MDLTTREKIITGIVTAIGLAATYFVLPDQDIALSPEPPRSAPVPMAVTWAFPDGRATCWDFKFANKHSAVRFAAFTESIDPRGATLIVRFDRTCDVQDSGAL